MIGRSISVTAVALVFMAACPVTVLAHANLVKCTIHNNQVFPSRSAPRTVVGTFAEDLDPNGSWMAVFEGTGDHGLVNEKTQSHLNFKNPKQLILTLPKGTFGKEKYYLLWYTKSAVDGHVAAGVVYFRVK